MAQLKSWSFSTWNTFANGCKRKLYYQKIEKLPDPPGPALVFGQRMHEQLEHYMLYEGRPFPQRYISWKDEVDALIEVGATAEREIALTRDWKETEWMAKDAWVRLKIDVSWMEGTIFNVVDYKTGKVYESSKKQIELYGVVGLLLDESATGASCALWYLDQEEIQEKEFDRSGLEQAQAWWHEEGEKITSETNFDPSPSAWNCKFCPFSKWKNGPCQEAEPPR